VVESTPKVIAPWDDDPAPAIAAAPVDANVTPMAAAAAAAAEAPQASTAPQRQAEPQREPEPEAPRRAGGASAALDVLRSAGMKVSTDRGGARAAASPAATAATPATPAKAMAPRVAVRVPTPDPARRAAAAAQQQDNAAAPRAQAPQRAAQPQGGSSVPPWDDIPPDDYMPVSPDDAFFAPSDDNFVPVFDSGPDDVRIGRGNASAAMPAPEPAVDIRTLPAAVPLNAIGFDGDWPALAITLPLKGISYQLAFNSELMAVEGKTLKLNVAVQMYTDVAQIAKLKAALAERLGTEIDVLVEVGPVKRTAAVLDTIERAKRQREAELEIGADPFVQSLIREFGGSIVPGSVRPLSADAGQNAAH
jgi:DNA polymerase III subunit gamma/tau